MRTARTITRRIARKVAPNPYDGRHAFGFSDFYDLTYSDGGQSGGTSSINYMLQAKLNGGSTTDANGKPDGLTNVEYHIWNGCTPQKQYRPGTYWVCGTGTGATIELRAYGLTTQTATPANGADIRLTTGLSITLPALPDAAGPDEELNYPARNWLKVWVGAAGAGGRTMTDLALVHDEDLSDYLAGKVMNAPARATHTTNSKGPIGFGRNASTVTVWIADGDAPYEDFLTNTYNYSSGAANKQGTKSIKYFSQKRAAQHAMEVGAPFWLHCPQTLTDAGIQSMMADIASVYTSGQVVVEGGLEPWGSSFYDYVRDYYGQPAVNNTGWYVGGTQAPWGTLTTGHWQIIAGKNAAHFVLRLWKYAIAAFGENRVVCTYGGMLVNPTATGYAMSYVDPGFVEAGKTLGQLMNERGQQHGPAVAAYIPGCRDDTVSSAGAGAPVTGRGINQVTGYGIVLSYREMAERQIWNASVYNDNDPQTWLLKAMKNSIDLSAYWIGQYNADADANGWARVKWIYEGATPDYIYSSNTTAQLWTVGYACTYTASTGELVPTTASINGNTLSDSGKTLSDMYADYDICRLVWVTSGPAGHNDSKNYRCKIISGKLYLYTSEANYIAGIAATGGANDSAVIVVNQTRLQALLDFVFSTYSQLSGNDGTGEHVLAYYRRKMAELGVLGTMVYTAVGQANDSRTVSPKRHQFDADTPAIAYLKSA